LQAAFVGPPVLQYNHTIVIARPACADHFISLLAYALSNMTLLAGSDLSPRFGQTILETYHSYHKRGCGD
jgi:hypothetical protein